MSKPIEKIKEIARKIVRIKLEIAGEKIVRQGRMEQETKIIERMEGGRIKEIEMEEQEKKLKE